jgi:hypothetical protein
MTRKLLFSVSPRLPAAGWAQLQRASRRSRSCTRRLDPMIGTEGKVRPADQWEPLEGTTRSRLHDDMDLHGERPFSFITMI